jgi:hypothetical protein
MMLTFVVFFYNFRLVCFELLAESEDLGSHDFELEEDEISCALGASFRNLGFNNKICTFIENSAKKFILLNTHLFRNFPNWKSDDNQ